MSEDILNESLIERLKQLSSKPNDNIEQLRSIAARLHSRTASLDKTVREKTLERIWRKNNGALGLILNLLENVRDYLTQCSLAGILHECVSPRSAKHRSPAVQQLIAMNATQIFVKILQQIQAKELRVPDSFLQELLWVVSKFAQKDSKFSLKTRLLGASKTFHVLLRTQYNNQKMLFPLLVITKALSKNAYTTALLAKEGIVSTMEKTILSVGLSPGAKLRLSVNILSHLTKNRSCCNRITKTSLVTILFRVVERWERYEGKMRIKIFNHTFATLQNLCACKLGRRAIRGNGISLLQKFCVNCPEDKSYDTLLTRVCNIINMCLEKKSLPVDTFTSPAMFNLPYAKESSVDIKVQSSSSRETSPGSDDDTTEEFPDDEVDEDGVIQEDGKNASDNKEYALPQNAVLRDIDDLKQYETNFQELNYPFCSKSKCCLQGSFAVSKKSISFDNALLEDREKHKENFQNALKENHVASSIDTRTSLCSSTNDNSNNSSNLDGKFLYIQGTNFSRSGGGEDIVKTNSSLITQKRTSISGNSSETLLGRDSCSTDNNVKGLSILTNIPNYSSSHYAYSIIASRVNSVLPFVKVAYPDMMGGDGAGNLEPLNVKDRKTCRSRLLTCVERGLHPNQLMEKVVYDLDCLTAGQPQSRLINYSEKVLFNVDERHLGSGESARQHLVFESRFESGNLRKAIQIGLHEYDLILMPDVNSSRHHQWFYFEVSGMETNVNYTFNIINCEKQNSQFNYGMKPIMYSVQEAVNGHPGWIRVGKDICYYRNSYQNPSGKYRTYLSTTFSLKFPHAHDVCYLAYHFPYTYSMLLTQIWKWATQTNPSEIYFRAESLCSSLNNNETPLLTISAPESVSNPLENREIVFLTARVHPGESNSSWVMHGTLSYLLGDTAPAVKLRNTYIFKIVPMLNMEGVINGCHRCGLTDEDLNRRWSRPNQNVHPVIYHTKGLLEYCVRVLNKVPYLFCDYHGHSRRKNVFFYGCCNSDSWNEIDRAKSDNPIDYLVLPNLMKTIAPAFALPLCSFKVERARESTARVTVWREFGIKRSYTMETSYCGCDQGTYMGYHLDTVHLKEVGANFCEALAALKEETQWQSDILESSQDSARNNLFPYMNRPAEPSESPDHSDSSDTDDDYHCLAD